MYSGSVKYFPILKGAGFKKWATENYTFELLGLKAVEITGNVTKNDHVSMMKSADWLVVEAMEDVIFAEYQ